LEDLIRRVGFPEL